MRRLLAVLVLVGLVGCRTGQGLRDVDFSDDLEVAVSNVVGNVTENYGRPTTTTTTIPPATPPPSVGETTSPPPAVGPEPDPARMATYGRDFLWKPVSENNGKLVVLAPSAFTGHIQTTWLDYGGTRESAGPGGAVANGNRWHSRFSKPGSGYPAGVRFALRTDSGKVWYWQINSPGSRVQGLAPASVE